MIGALRSTVGVVGIAWPESLGRFSGLDTVTARRTAWLTRMAAARDLALGVGQVVAVVRRPSDPAAIRLWAFAGALADAGDVAALSRAVVGGQIAPVRGGLMAGSAVGAVAAALPALTPSRSSGRRSGD